MITLNEMVIRDEGRAPAAAHQAMLWNGLSTLYLFGVCSNGRERLLPYVICTNDIRKITQIL